MTPEREPITHTRGKLMNGHLYFEIRADDLHRAAEFSESIFGRQFEEPQEGQPVEHRQEYFADPDGNTFGIFEVDETAA